MKSAQEKPHTIARKSTRMHMRGVGTKRQATSKKIMQAKRELYSKRGSRLQNQQAQQQSHVSMYVCVKKHMHQYIITYTLQAHTL